MRSARPGQAGGRNVVVIGSGAGGSSAAMVLAEAGFSVTILEKGKNYFRGLDDPDALGLPLFGGDEIRDARGWPGMDAFAEPRTLRSQAEARDGVARSFTGDVNLLPATVGGGTTHWDAKVPRFWKTDFEMASRWGPIEGAAVVDWPFGYDDLAPYYTACEDILGVSGDLDATPEFVREAAPRGPYPMPSNPPMYAARVFQEAAAHLGYQVHPAPEAINSVPHDGRPPCHNCGYCSRYGCPVNARGGAAVTFLRRALLAGARLVTRAMVTKIVTGPDGCLRGVDYLAGGTLAPTHLPADVVILAASAVESARIALLSASGKHPDGLGNRSGRVGRSVCFHASTFATAVMPQRLHAYRGRAASHFMLEPCLPRRDWGWTGLPWFRGGVVEVGGSPRLIDEALIYDETPFLRRAKHKDLMRSSPLRDRLLGVQMLGEDLPQLANRVDLDPEVRDVYGLPVARVSFSWHRHEKVASLYWGLELRRICKATGAEHALFYPSNLGFSNAEEALQTRHQSGTLRMGSDPERSVVDAFGRMHDVPQVVVCDGSVFPTSGAFNPTLTIMAVAMRSATALAHGEEAARGGPLLKRPAGAAPTSRAVPAPT
jgi:choline dehydrogenase-like flavoprotein